MESLDRNDSTSTNITIPFSTLDMCHIYSPIQDCHMLVIVMNCGFYSLKIRMRVLADYAGGMFAYEKQGENR
jgi:hypothetical protein